MIRIVVIICLVCVAGGCSHAQEPVYVQVTQQQMDTILTRTQLELHLNPAYVFGAAGIDPGVPGDCSGKVRAILMAAGIKLERMRASDISQAKDGWRFPVVMYSAARPGAVVVMTLQKHRPNGHVGMLVESVQDGKTRMAHASSTWGFIAVVIDANKPKNYWYPKITRIRQVDSRE